MNEISHQVARSLLQSALDYPLAQADRANLDTHLAVCAECSQYAEQLLRLETNLRDAFHTRWDGYRPALNSRTIQNPSATKLFWNGLFSQAGGLGKLTVIAALLLGYFVIANVLGVRLPVFNNETPTALPTPNASSYISNSSPTPSTQPTLFDPDTLNCKTTRYLVQENDTLESIAVHYGVTMADIIEHNQGDPSLAANTVFTGMTLVIPMCKTTPVYTTSLPTNTFTLTPTNGTILPDHPE